jgi:DNA (cytosine-5)-methyltransferase 1
VNGASVEEETGRLLMPKLSSSQPKPSRLGASGSKSFVALEICAGGGGQALGLELAGFEHAAVVEIDSAACATLRANRPGWNVVEGDLHSFNGKPFKGIDLLAGGVPCPPFSVAGKQLGADDERDLFPEALRLVREIKPRAVMLENVRGLADPKFAPYREAILKQLEDLGYRSAWRLLNASDFGVPQLRPRFILVSLQRKYANNFVWPAARHTAPTVGETLLDLMSARGWPGAKAWARTANGIGPTIVGGSKKHGGPDLGPTRARRQWAQLGVDGLSIANEAPDGAFPASAMPKLTVQMVARIQGFPDSWQFVGKKTAAYRQVGNAFPPPVAAAVGKAIADALSGKANCAEPSHGLSGLPLLELMERKRSPARRATSRTAR